MLPVAALVSKLVRHVFRGSSENFCSLPATYTYPPLNGSHQYLPPKGDDTADLICDCNTVMYRYAFWPKFKGAPMFIQPSLFSLYMACSTCQGGQIYS